MWCRSVWCRSETLSLCLSVCLWLGPGLLSSSEVNWTRTPRTWTGPWVMDSNMLLLWFLSDLAVAAGKLRATLICSCVRSNVSICGEMSAVSPDQIQPGEENRTGAEEAGILQPQTVFVILDSAETVNLVRWVRKFWELPLFLPRRRISRQTPFKNLYFKVCVVAHGTEHSRQVWGVFRVHRNNN